VLAAVGEYRQSIVQAGRGDEEIKVTNELACFSELAAFSPKNFAHLFVDAKNGYIFKKGIERLLALLRASGVVHPFRELRKGDDAQHESLGSQLLESVDHSIVVDQMIDDPISIDEINESS
jgi:hypothetical protein